MMAILLAAASCVAVDGDRILARDLASASAAFATVEPDAELGYAPAPGASRTFHPAELKRMIARHGGTPGGEVGPLCIERATLPLSTSPEPFREKAAEPAVLTTKSKD